MTLIVMMILHSFIFMTRNEHRKMFYLTSVTVFDVGKFLTLVCLRKTKCIIIVVVLHKQNTKMKEEASASSHEFETQKG